MITDITVQITHKLNKPRVRHACDTQKKYAKTRVRLVLACTRV